MCQFYTCIQMLRQNTNYNPKILNQKSCAVLQNKMSYSDARRKLEKIRDGNHDPSPLLRLDLPTENRNPKAKQKCLAVIII